MSGNSSVGQASVYEAGDQRNVSKKEELDDVERFDEGKENSHNSTDPKDERSIANRLAAEEKKNKEDDNDDTLETRRLKKDPTLPARAHGNEPSKGAKIDAQIADEEAEIIAKMDAKKANKN